MGKIAIGVLKQMKMVFNVGHLWVPWPQVVVTQG
jgi:hypothetical protein